MKACCQDHQETLISKVDIDGKHIIYASQAFTAEILLLMTVREKYRGREEAGRKHVWLDLQWQLRKLTSLISGNAMP